MRIWTRRALIGGLLWILCLPVCGLRSPAATAAALLLFGSLVAVPLALRLIDPTPPGLGRGRWVLARRLHPPCAAALLVAFLLSPGTLAGLLSLPWLLFTALVTLLGILRFCERGGGPVHSIAVEAGMVFLIVGGVWTAASRFGSTLLGFAEPWVLLTGVHFHFAGLVLSIVTGELARRVAPGNLGTLACIGVVIGVPLVAAGITAGAGGLHTFEWLTALWMVLASLLTATLLMVVGGRQKNRASFVLLCIAGLSLFASMVLAGIYATGVWLRHGWLEIPEMVLSHGMLNAFGFTVPALMALPRGGRPDDRPGMEILIPLLGDEPVPGLWESRQPSREVRGAADGVHVDCHERRFPGEEPGPPVPGGPFLQAAAAVMRYEAFPPTELRTMVERTPVEVGDTLRGRYRLLPGVDVMFAARVVDVFDTMEDGVQKKGFTYQTLAGHPIHGAETFCVEKNLATGEVLVRIAARSCAATWLCSLARPIVRRLQLRAGRRGVEHLEEVARDG